MQQAAAKRAIQAEMKQLRQEAVKDPAALSDLAALQATEALSAGEVSEYIRAAKADCHDNLLTFIGALQHFRTFRRHVKRFYTVAGVRARASFGIKIILIPAGGIIPLLLLLLFEPTYPWPVDLSVCAVFLPLLIGLAWQDNTYSLVFLRTLVIERRHFTDPTQASGLLFANLPRLTVYDRPEILRGNNGQNGIFDRNAFAVLQTGKPVAVWLDVDGNPTDEVPDLIDGGHTEIETYTEERETDEEEINPETGEWEPVFETVELEREVFIPDTRDVACTVEWGKRISEFRNPFDYYDLQPDPYMARGDRMITRRTGHRVLQRVADLFFNCTQAAPGYLEDKWQYIVMAGGYGGAVILVMWILGG